MKMTNEYKRLAHMCERVHDDLDYQPLSDDVIAIKDILTTLAAMSESEPPRMEGLELVTYKKVVNIEYADHWRNKAMQLEVFADKVQAERDHFIKENEQLRQQLAEAQKDVERIDWLAQQVKS